MKNIKIEISPSIWIMGAALILSHDSTAKEICTLLSAVLIHEFGHILAARVLKIQIKCIRLDIFGAIMETDSILCSYKKEAILCLAGPLANIASVIFIRSLNLPVDLNLFTLASFAFAIINLLPAKCFDGGRALSCILLWRMSHPKASYFIEILSFICVFLLWTISVYFLMRTGSYLSLFIFSGSLFAKLFLIPEKFKE